MPVLSNPKHEAFAQALAKGKTADQAYQHAGYKANRHNAATLMRKQHISTRLAELQERSAKRLEVTVESLSAELDEARALALTSGQISAAVSATMGKAKLHGKLVEKRQHSGHIATIDVAKLKGMSTEELDLLERALVQIGLVDGDTPGEGGEEV